MLYGRFLAPLVTRQILQLLASAVLLPLAVFGQDQAAPNSLPDPLAPIYITTRVFQISAKKGSYPDVSDQVFRLKSAGLVDEEKWLTAFGKTYPGLTPALLQTSNLRVFRTSKPGVINLGQHGERSLRILLLAAQSPGDGTTPGTTLVPDIGLYSVNSSIPLTLALMPLEIESGTTYFFAAQRLKLNPQDYNDFFRAGASVTAFAEEDHYLVVAFSIELTRPAPTTRQFNEQQSAVLLTEAKKKVQPALNETVKKAGLSGRVQVRVEITPDGKVLRALTQSSTLPEMNSAAVAAARQWEFSPALFADNKNPISGLLTFDFAASDAKPAVSKQSSSN